MILGLGTETSQLRQWWAQVTVLDLQIQTAVASPILYLFYDLPVAPQDEAGLTTTFQTWPRGWFHIPKDPDFPVPS